MRMGKLFSYNQKQIKNLEEIFNGGHLTYQYADYGIKCNTNLWQYNVSGISHGKFK